tara:strand:+ start:4404 stop:4865 length:462 start_codon:yes stop_codon:yes gene_type:complete
VIVTTARLLTRRRRLAILTGIDSNLRLLILDFTRLLNGRNDLTRLDLALLSLLRNPNEPVEEQSADDVDQDVDPEDTEVAPSLAVLVVNQLEECVGVAEWAVFTAGCSLGVGNVAASCLDVLAHIGVAGLLWEGFEAEELDFGTFDWDVGEGG